MRKEQRQRYLRYFANYIRHATPKKVLNLLRVEWRLATNNHGITGVHPYFLFVDISNACNLRCPLCQTGLRKTIARKSQMNMENYRKIIMPIKDYLFQVFLYNWGEPFLNKHIYDIIAFNHSLNIGTVVSSHFSLPVDAARLVESDLDYLVISGDSHDPDTYATYRVGGSIETVLKNLDSLVEVKKRSKSSRPYIEWQCIVTRYNEHQLAKIEHDMYQRGVNLVRFINVNFYSADDPEEAERIWLPQNPAYRKLARRERERPRSQRKPCFWLWRTAVVNSDGGVTPCCLYDIPSWGNALDDELMDVWTGDDYTEARLRSHHGGPHRKSLICDRCDAPFIYR